MMNGMTFLDGQLLLAMPGIGDPRFDHSLIYLCAHSEEGAMGIMVNKYADDISVPDLLERLEIISRGEQIDLPGNVKNMQVHMGGPVETGRGFVLHSTDYFADDCTLPIDPKIGLTATLDVLRAIAEGKGPEQFLLALGYAGWGPGQLEHEILSNGWLHCAATQDLVFGTDLDLKYNAALTDLGIDPRLLSTNAGHA